MQDQPRGFEGLDRKRMIQVTGRCLLNMCIQQRGPPDSLQRDTNQCSWRKQTALLRECTQSMCTAHKYLVWMGSEAVLRQARLRIEENKPEDALALLEIVHKDPRSRFRALKMRAEVHQLLGDLPAAIADLTSALAIKDHGLSFQDVVLAQRSKCYIDLGDTVRALADINQAIALNPLNFKAFHNRGWILFNSGDLQGSLHDFSACISLDPMFCLAYLNRAKVLIAQGRIESAISDLVGCLKKCKGDLKLLSFENMLDALFLLSRCYLQTRKYKEAASTSTIGIDFIEKVSLPREPHFDFPISQMEKIVLRICESLDVKFLDLFCIAGESLLGLREYSKAVELLGSYIAAVSNHQMPESKLVRCLLLRACAMYHLNMHNDAVLDTTTVLTSYLRFCDQQEILTALDIRASSFKRMGNLLDCQKDLEAALEIFPSSEYLKSKISECTNPPKGQPGGQRKHVKFAVEETESQKQGKVRDFFKFLLGTLLDLNASHRHEDPEKLAALFYETIREHFESLMSLVESLGLKGLVSMEKALWGAVHELKNEKPVASKATDRFGGVLWSMLSGVQS